jgi:hypothetical protein
VLQFFGDDIIVVGWIVMCLNPALEIFRIFKTNGWAENVVSQTVGKMILSLN